MLDISPVLLLSSAIIFLLVLARLNSCLFEPLLRHMDERSEQIKKDLEDAKNNSADVEGMLVEANNIVANAKQEAAMIRQKASNEATEVAQSKIKVAKADLEVKYARFVEELESEKVNLRETLNNSVPIFKESLKAKVSSI